MSIKLTQMKKMCTDQTGNFFLMLCRIMLQETVYFRNMSVENETNWHLHL